MAQIQCPNCNDWLDESRAGGGPKPDGGLLVLILGGVVLSGMGLLCIAVEYVGSGVIDESAGSGHFWSVFGSVLLAVGVLCFGLALWLYRAKRVRGAVSVGSWHHCGACGHDWDEYSHADLRAGMPTMSASSAELVRADRDETAG